MRHPTSAGVPKGVLMNTTGYGRLIEALTAVQAGLLTIYDRCKAADRGMVMTNVRVLQKHGGKRPDWRAAVCVIDSFGFPSEQLTTLGDNSRVD